MSRIIKCGSEICRANTNNSTAKFQYSFSKASRFPIPNYAEQLRQKKLQAKLEKGEEVPQIKKKINSDYPFYKIPSTLSLRKTTFGFGKKYDFTKIGNNCIKSCYNPGTDFDPKNPHGPKYSFTRAPRSGKAKIQKKKKPDEETEENNKKNELIDPDGPSPAKYYYLKPFGYDAPKVSMKFRHGDTPKKKGDKEGEDEPEKKAEEKSSLTKVTIQITRTGKYPVSQIPNVNSVQFGNDKSKRTQFVTNKNPAPGDYKLPKILGGHVIESQYRSYEPITIAQRHQVKDSRSNYPGPGSYPLPSDFGQYESKDADKYPKENVYVVEKPKFEEKAWRNNMKKIEPKKKKEDDEYNYDYNNDYNDSGNDYNNDKVEKSEENSDKNIVEKYSKIEEKTPKEEEKKEQEEKTKEEEKKEEGKKEEEKKEEEKKEQKIMEDVKKEDEKKEEIKKEIEKEKEEDKKEEIKKEVEKEKEEDKKEEEKKEENKKEEEKKEDEKEKEEDKKSEYILLRDILEYK